MMQNSLVVRNSFFVWSLVLIVAAGCGETLSGVTRIEVDTIRNKRVLTDADLEVVKGYVNEQFNELLEADDAGDLALIGRNLLGGSRYAMEGAESRRKYSDAYAKVVRLAYLRVIRGLNNVEDKSLAKSIRLTAAVVLANTDNVIVINDLVNMLKGESEELRYWAVRGLSMPNIQSYLVSGSDGAVAELQNVLSTLARTLQNESSGLVITQIALAAPVRVQDNDQGVQLIQDAVAKRIKQYQMWSVDNELMDWNVLDKIFTIIKSGRLTELKQMESAMMRSASALFSVAYDRMVKGMTHEVDGKVVPLLQEKNHNELATLLIMGEEGFFNVCNVQNRQKRFANAIPRGRYNELKANYAYLFNPTGPVNQLYNIFPKGTAQNDLPVVSEPPAELVDSMTRLHAIEKSARR